jgi:pimeloyl-ACP methyl ester carboxylesterase
MAPSNNATILQRDVFLPPHLQSTEREVQGRHQHQPTTLNIRYYRPTTVDLPAPTVLFLQFWGGHTSTFEPVQLELSKIQPSHISIAVSYRRTGDELGMHDILELAADVVNLLEQIQSHTDESNLIPSRRVILCAHSVSTKVSWEDLRLLNKQRSINVSGLLLLAPSLPGPMILPATLREQ